MPVDKPRIVGTYSAAADYFDELPFWSYFGRRTIDRLALAPGARVLDLCCGTGASALPAAERVGPEGFVLGVDVTGPLVARAQAKAAARWLENVEFRAGDVDHLDFAPASFDAVVSVFGLFFLEDMEAVVRRAWQWLRPQGQLAVTTWGGTVLAPGEGFFWDAVRAEDPALAPVSPLELLSEPGSLTALFRAADLPDPRVESETWQMPLKSPEDFWPVILGTSNRGVLNALPGEAQARVRASVLAALRANEVTALDFEVLYATVRKTTDGEHKT
jgi:SAM-dependent methyltransferase